VLQAETGSLGGGDRRWCKRSTGENMFVTRDDDDKNTIIIIIIIIIINFPMAQQPPVGQGLLIIDASRLHSDTHHSR
jgi:hypothetical protein